MAKHIYKGDKFVHDGVYRELMYTPYNVIKKNVDKEFVGSDGKIKSTHHDGYLGIWSYALERESRTYYIVQDAKITEVILYEQNNEVYYIIELNGYMYNCIPEEGDIIYSTYKEARLELMKSQESKTDDIQIRQQI